MSLRNRFAIDNLAFAKGQVISRDGMMPQVIEQLFARGALLEPVP